MPSFGLILGIIGILVFLGFTLRWKWTRDGKRETEEYYKNRDTVRNSMVRLQQMEKEKRTRERWKQNEKILQMENDDNDDQLGVGGCL